MKTIWIVWYNAGYSDESYDDIDAIYDNELNAKLHCSKKNLLLESADTSDYNSGYYEVSHFWVKEHQLASKLLI